jgi:hypothetical protein
MTVLGDVVSLRTVTQTIDEVESYKSKTPIDEGSDISSNGMQTDTPATSPETAHPSDDISLSLGAKAPPVQSPYLMANATLDLPCAAYALELFLASHMLESEDYMHKGDPKK